MITERPILMSAPMVRALQAGTKTQTRRIVKLPHMNPLGKWEPSTFGGPNGGRTREGLTVPLQACIWHTRTGDSIACPHGQPGDRLWVRETWHTVDGEHAFYRADYQHDPIGDRQHGVTWRPSIHMPRWASRITLEITEVRVQRLQEISADDAYNEGTAEWAAETVRNGNKWPNIVRAYHGLWESINGPGSWDANPWVWAISFRRITEGRSA